METQKLQIQNDHVLIRIFALDGANGAGEYLCMFTLEPTEAPFGEQLGWLLKAYDELLASRFHGQVPGLAEARPVFKRFYLSDAANQADTFWAAVGQDDCAVSTVQQPPLCGGKVGMWAWLMTGVQTARVDDHLFRASHGGYDELWSTQNTANGDTSYVQTAALFGAYAERLRRNGCTLAANCVRTWLYVNDIDNHYDGVVRARNDVFDREGLTDQTHYIASTGICGRDADPRTLCKMNALAIGGIRPEQVHYLYALDHLNRTSEYGVRFERGTCVDFDGRRRVFISGTASIDNRGNIVHVGDIRGQVERMWENIEALLAEAGCTFDDVAEMTVYLRDVADYPVVASLMAGRFPHTPYIIVNAPVCRPGWLIETECIAMKPLSEADAPAHA